MAVIKINLPKPELTVKEKDLLQAVFVSAAVMGTISYMLWKQPLGKMWDITFEIDSGILTAFVLYPLEKLHGKGRQF